MRKLFLAGLAVLVYPALATAQAQQADSVAGDVQNGHHLAAIICSNCHVAGPDQIVEPILQPPAPSLESIARRSTTNADALKVFLATTHSNISNTGGMPNPQLLDFQITQVVAYLLSLRQPSAASPGAEPSETQAGSCRGGVTRLELALRQARANGKSFGEAPESSAARLHLQPTPQSVQQATREAEKAVATELALARKLESQGREAECAAVLKRIESSLD